MNHGTTRSIACVFGVLQRRCEGRQRVGLSCSSWYPARLKSVANCTPTPCVPMTEVTAVFIISPYLLGCLSHATEVAQQAGTCNEQAVERCFRRGALRPGSRVG